MPESHLAGQGLCNTHIADISYGSAKYKPLTGERREQRVRDRERERERAEREREEKDYNTHFADISSVVSK